MPKRWSPDGIRTSRATGAHGTDPAKEVMVAVMGITGTGKSTFIQLLTGDESIKIGHGQDSKTADVQTIRYMDTAHGCNVTLIDTPGFDDSRGVPDTEILQRIVDFLKPEKGEPRKLNGIIYMHNISLPRFTGVQQKNLRLFQSLCGNDNLKNVRIVTTNWDRVTRAEGNKREKELLRNQFKVLVDAGTGMHRHRFNDKKSAQEIMSGFSSLGPVTMQIQKELEDPENKLEDTSAGAVLVEMTQEVLKKHDLEMMELQRERDAAEADLALQAALAGELEELKQQMKTAEEGRKRLAMTLGEVRAVGVSADMPIRPSRYRCPVCNSSSSRPRNLAVFIDGTSNKPDPKATNVWKLFDVTPDTEGHAVEQHTRYFKGIGAHDTVDLPLSSYLPKVIYAGCEMAIAWNAEKNVRDAYQWLTDTYQTGDQIYLFGFSRGAYQVRALAGMIHEVGLLKKGESRIDDAYDCYRSINPKSPTTKDKATTFKKTYGRPGVRIHFMGVWDTVSSLGLVKKDAYIPPFAALNLCHLRHALALDECRVKFTPEYYMEVNPHPGHVEPNLTDVKEVWFAGCHSDIGGTTRSRAEVAAKRMSHVGVGNVPLVWMKREAADKGLVFDPERFSWWPEDVDPGRGHSMNPLWRILEVVRVRHRVSFSGTGKLARRKHGLRPRLVIPGQRIHPSVFAADGYTPHATLAHGIEIPTVPKRTSPEDGGWPIDPRTTEPADEKETTGLLTSLLSDQQKTLQCLGEVLLLLNLRLDNKHSGTIHVPEWLKASMHEVSGSDEFALIVIYDGISGFLAADALVNEAKAALCAILTSPDLASLPRALYILRFAARHQALRRRFIAHDDVVDALVLSLERTAESRSTDAFPFILDSLCCLIDDERSRTKVVSRLTAQLNSKRALSTRLSLALQVKEPSHLTASLKMIASLARHEPGHCDRLWPKIINLATEGQGLVGSLAVEVLVALNAPGRTLGKAHFANIIGYITNTLPRLDAEIDSVPLLGEIDVPLVLRVNASTQELNDKIMHKFMPTIRLRDVNQRTAATLTLLKLCNSSIIRKFWQNEVLDTFMEQMNRKETSLLAAYALRTCLRHEDMWKPEHFHRVAQLVVNMVDKGWFDDAVGRVEGAAIFREFLKSDELGKKIIDLGVVDTLTTKLGVGDHHEVRMGLKCLEIIWEDNPADLERTVIGSLTLLKDKNVKNRKRGINTLASLAQTEAGEKAIKPHVNTIVGMLLPPEASPLLRHQLYGPVAVLCELCKNATLRGQIEESEGYKSFKALRRNSTFYPPA